MKHFLVLTTVVLACTLCAGELQSTEPTGEQEPLTSETAPFCLSLSPESVAPAPEIAAASCTVSVDCDDGTTIQCSGASCQGKDRNCSNGERGFVDCDGNTQYCPVCDCHNHCEPCASYGQTDDCGLVCKRNVYCCDQNGICGVRIGAWVLAF